MHAWKWVTQDRMSPNFDGGVPLKYSDGDVVRAGGKANDRQCASGLHVLSVGVWPEWCGLCDPGHDLIPLLVAAPTDKILFGGLPGDMDKRRVAELRVIGVAPGWPFKKAGVR
jgi:hypothetical protein